MMSPCGSVDSGRHPPQCAIGHGQRRECECECECERGSSWWRMANPTISADMSAGDHVFAGRDGGAARAEVRAGGVEARREIYLYEQLSRTGRSFFIERIINITQFGASLATFFFQRLFWYISSFLLGGKKTRKERTRRNNTINTNHIQNGQSCCCHRPVPRSGYVHLRLDPLRLLPLPL